MTTLIRRAGFLGTRFRLSLLVVTAACTDGPDQASGPGATTVRDSAGIRIVTSEGPRWGAGEGWTVIPEPDLVIGDEDPMGGGTDTLFGSIRAMVVLPSGRFAVADEHSAVISVFDPHGQLVHRFGGHGEGPGEVGGVWDLYGCAGDTVIVRFRTELSFFDGDGQFIRRINCAGAGTTWALAAIAPDCRRFVASHSTGGSAPPAGQEWLLPSVLVYTDDDFVATDTIAREVTGEGFTGSLRGEDVFVALP